MESHMENQNTHDSIKDKFSLSYVLFYTLGVVTIVPSHFFTTATDYWLYKFRDFDSNVSYSANNKTELQAQFTSNYSIVSNVGYVVFIIATIRYIRVYINAVQRTIGSLSVEIILFALTCIFVKVDTDPWQRTFYVVTLIIGFFATGMSGIFIVTVFGMALRFPRSHVPTIFSGQAICGILASLVQILALGEGGSPENTALIYFIIGTIFILLSILSFLTCWSKSEFIRHHLGKEITKRRKRPEFNKEIILSALNKSKYYLASMFIVLGCTVMLHPGVIELVESVDKGNGNQWNDKFFGPTINFLFYNLFDYIGREIAMFFKLPFSGLTILIISLCRIPLVPLILFCNAQPRDHLKVGIDSDAAYIIFLIIFAFSNGLLVNTNIRSVPSVTNEKETPFAMLCILLLMILSLAFSSSVSSLLVGAL